MQDGRSEHGEVTQFAKAKMITLGKNRSLFTNLLTYSLDRHPFILPFNWTMYKLSFS